MSLNLDFGFCFFGGPSAVAIRCGSGMSSGIWPNSLAAESALSRSRQNPNGFRPGTAIALLHKKKAPQRGAFVLSGLIKAYRRVPAP